jgi:hypothetical protein
MTPSSSAIIELPPSVFLKRAREEARRSPKRIMPFAYVRCPQDHILRMPAASIAQGRECFCPHCRSAFQPAEESIERARYHLEIGTRARSPLPPILAGSQSCGRTLLPAGLKIAARRTWRRMKRLLLGHT